MRRSLRDESVDLCYIDPPFNSQRDYNQIYNGIGDEQDQAQAQAFTDTWSWDDMAIAGYDEIIANAEGRFSPQVVDLIKGLHSVLGPVSLFAYLVSLTQRITEIFRILKPTGSFYLHCDPTASHYLKIVLDAIFVANGGDFKNEIIWKRTTARSDSTSGITFTMCCCSIRRVSPIHGTPNTRVMRMNTSMPFTTRWTRTATCLCRTTSLHPKNAAAFRASPGEA